MKKILIIFTIMFLVGLFGLIITDEIELENLKKQQGQVKSDMIVDLPEEYTTIGTDIVPLYGYRVNDTLYIRFYFH